MTLADIRRLQSIVEEQKSTEKRVEWYIQMVRSVGV